jgi:hypothetical protein
MPPGSTVAIGSAQVSARPATTVRICIEFIR